MKKHNIKNNKNIFIIGLIAGISLILLVGIIMGKLLINNDNSYFARIRVAIKKKVQIVYNQNLFDGNKIDNSGIKEYDSDKQEITFDGKLEGNHINLGTLNVKLKKSERYRVTINYLSGSYDKEGEPKFIFELQKDNEYYTDRKNGTHYVFETLPTEKDKPIDKVLTIKDEVVDATNILYRLYQENEVEFKNYKIQISITKLESKIGVAGEKYGKLPTPEKDGYEFLGWYDSISGGKKVTETNTILKKYNHPLYAHWQKNIIVNIGSFNIGFSRCGSGLLDKCHPSEKDFIDIINNNTIDIIGMQEAKPEKTVLNVSKKSGLQYNHLSHPAEINAVLSKYEIKSKSTTKMAGNTGCSENRSLDKVVVNINGIDISFYNTHLGLRNCNEEHFKIVADVLKKDPNPIIITGDFNYTYIKRFDLYFKPLGFEIAAYDTLTHNMWKRQSYCDGVYVKSKGHIDIISSKSIDVYGKYSDHNFIYATLSIH